VAFLSGMAGRQGGNDHSPGDPAPVSSDSVTLMAATNSVSLLSPSFGQRSATSGTG